MKFSIIAAALGVASLVAAQDLTQLPQCAQDCAIKSLGTSSCPAGDFNCYCKSEDFIKAVTECITSSGACKSAEDIQAATVAAASLCPSSSLVSSIISSISGAPSARTTSPSNTTHHASDGPTSTHGTSTSTSTGAAASILPGGFAAAALVAAVFAL